MVHEHEEEKTPIIGATPPKPVELTAEEWEERKIALKKAGTPPARIVELVKMNTEAKVLQIAIERILGKEQQITGYVGYAAIPSGDEMGFYDQTKITDADIERFNREVNIETEPNVLNLMREIEAEIEKKIKG